MSRVELEENLAGLMDEINFLKSLYDEVTHHIRLYIY